MKIEIPPLAQHGTQAPEGVKMEQLKRWRVHGTFYGDMWVDDLVNLEASARGGEKRLHTATLFAALDHFRMLGWIATT